LGSWQAERCRWGFDTCNGFAAHRDKASKRTRPAWAEYNFLCNPWLGVNRPRCSRPSKHLVETPRRTASSFLVYARLLVAASCVPFAFIGVLTSKEETGRAKSPGKDSGKGEGGISAATGSSS